MRKTILFLIILFLSPLLVEKVYAIQNTVTGTTFISNQTYSNRVYEDFSQNGVGNSSADPDSDSANVTQLTFIGKNDVADSCTIKARLTKVGYGTLDSNNTQTLTTAYQNLVFTFTSTTGFTNNNLLYIEPFYAGLGCSETHIKWNLQACDNCYAYGNIYQTQSPNSGSSTKDLYFITNNGIPTSMSIASPQNVSDNLVGNITVTGNCPVNGTKRVLVLMDSPSSSPIGVDTTTFANSAVDCVGHSYTKTFNVSTPGERLLAAIDYAWLGVYDSVSFGTCSARICYNILNFYETNYSWLLSIIRPTDDGSHYFNNLGYSDTYPFRFKYSVPNFANSSTPAFDLSYADSSFTTTTGHITTGYVNYLDPNGYGYIDTNLVVTTTPRYYTATLFVSGQQIYYQLNFETLGTASGTVLLQPSNLSNKDYGFWGNVFRDAFVPKFDTLTTFMTNLQDVLKDKIVFGQFYQLGGLIASSSVSTTETKVDFTFNYAGQTVTTTFLDTQNSSASNFLSILRPYEIAGIWIMYALAIIEIAIALDL